MQNGKNWRNLQQSRLVGCRYNEPENHLYISKIQIGDKAAGPLKKMPKDDKTPFSFVKEIMIKLADGLYKDLDLQNKILADLRCLFPRNRTADYEK